MMQATNKNIREESSMNAISRRLTIAGLVAGSLLAVLPASAQQFTMKLSMPTINDVTYEYFKRMKAGIEQRSGGKIKVDIYPSNQLGQLPAVVEGVALGTIEAAASANGFWVSLEPRFQVLDAPGLFDDLIHGNKMLNDPGIRARLATWGADKGVEILTPGLYSPLMILSHKAIRTIGDFQGQKIRTQGGAPIQVEPLKKTGAIPVSLPLGEALPAMQNKTIDGMVGAAAPYVAFKYYDIAKPMTFLPATLFAAPVVANRQFMKSLGPELEKIVREESAKAEVLFSDWNIADIKSKEEIWRKNGGEVITMSPEEAKRYVEMVSPVAASILSANPKVKDDYEALLAAAKKYR
jgi:C4-dicarboxylate-binding protein DctP